MLAGCFKSHLGLGSLSRGALCSRGSAPGSKRRFIAFQMTKRKEQAGSGRENGPCATESPAQANGAKRTKSSQSAEPSGRQYYSCENHRPEQLAGAGLRVLSWNVASLRSLLEKTPGCIQELVKQEQADILVLQETKLQDKATAGIQAKLGLPDWHIYWNCSQARKGYSGVALFSRARPIRVVHGIAHAEHDAEGRVITAEYPSLFFVTAYVPNAGEGLKRLDYRTQEWDAAFAGYLAGLSATKPVILAGDLNVAHQEIDIHNPKSNKRSAGFTNEERQSFSERLLRKAGLVDVFRAQHPDVRGYTYWHYFTKARERNAGWRIDYFLVSEALASKVHDAFLLPQIFGSDHCPIGLVLKDI